jgi:hypothetical protein
MPKIFLRSNERFLPAAYISAVKTVRVLRLSVQAFYLKKNLLLLRANCTPYRAILVKLTIETQKKPLLDFNFECPWRENVKELSFLSKHLNFIT